MQEYTVTIRVLVLEGVAYRCGETVLLYPDEATLYVRAGYIRKR